MRKWIKDAPKKIGASVTKAQLYFIYKLIANRQAFRFSFKTIIKNLLTNIKLSLCCNKKNKWADFNQSYFEKGKHKLAKDLDIERLLRILHGFEALRSVSLNKQDRFFLEYQKHRVIETNSEQSKGSSSENFAAGNLAPYGENEQRKKFLSKLQKYLQEYEACTLKES